MPPWGREAGGQELFAGRSRPCPRCATAASSRSAPDSCSCAPGRASAEAAALLAAAHPSRGGAARVMPAAHLTRAVSTRASRCWRRSSLVVARRRDADRAGACEPRDARWRPAGQETPDHAILFRDAAAARASRRRSSAGAWPARARRCRRSSATRSPTRTCSASRRARRSPGRSRWSRAPTRCRRWCRWRRSSARSGDRRRRVRAGRAPAAGRRRTRILLVGVVCNALARGGHHAGERDRQLRPGAGRALLDHGLALGAELRRSSRSPRPTRSPASRWLMPSRASDLNLLAAGEEGAPAARRRRRARAARGVFVAASLLVGAAVSVSGMIGFVGLIVPHLLRLRARARPAPAAAGVVPRRRDLPGLGRHARAHRARRRPSCRSAS